MTRDEMVAVIAGGGSVLYRGVIYTRSADLPSVIDTASGVPAETLTDASGNAITQWSVTVADAADATQGAKADAPWDGVAPGPTIMGVLKSLYGLLVRGVKTAANSLSISFASDQTGTAGSPATTVLSVQGVTNGTAQPVSGNVGHTDGTNITNVLKSDGTAAGQNAQLTSGTYLEKAALSATALNADLLPATDVSNYRWFSLHITAIATGGTITVQGSNDGVNWLSVVMVNITGTAGTVTSGVTTTGLFHGPIAYRYLRLRQTAWTSGTTSAVVELYTAPIVLQTMGVSALQNGAWTAVPNAGTVGGATPFKTISAATTNATSIKASAGQVYGAIAGNTTASWKYVKFYNKASAPTVGTDVPVFTLPVPPNGVAPYPSQVGMVFGTGIAYAITGGSADNDATAVAAGDVIVSGEYK